MQKSGDSNEMVAEKNSSGIEMDQNTSASEDDNSLDSMASSSSEPTSQPSSQPSFGPPVTVANIPEFKSEDFYNSTKDTPDVNSTYSAEEYMFSIVTESKTLPNAGFRNSGKEMQTPHYSRYYAIKQKKGYPTSFDALTLLNDYGRLYISPDEKYILQTKSLKDANSQKVKMNRVLELLLELTSIQP